MSNKTLMLFDSFIAAFGLLLLLPLILIIIILGYFDTGSPIFSQVRVGKDVKPFILLKFRTMRIHTESVATHQIGSNSVTKLGKILRKTKIDEILQLINVLKGEMSLVGPRPCLYQQEELIAIRKKFGIFEVLPGITGLAQINNVDMSVPHELGKIEQYMIKNYSIFNYFKYIILSIFGSGSGDNVKY